MNVAGRWAAALTAAALVSGCGGHSGGPAPRPSAADVGAGRHLFIANHCGTCHALKAAHAIGGPGPDFDTSERLTLGQIRRGLTEGANGMPSYAHLGRRALDRMAAFIFAATHP